MIFVKKKKQIKREKGSERKTEKERETKRIHETIEGLDILRDLREHKKKTQQKIRKKNGKQHAER